MLPDAPLPTEIVVLGLSVLLLFVHVMLQGQLVTKERGLAWNAGARDEEKPKLGTAAGRASRALDNFKETYPAFIAAVLAVVVTGRAGGWSDFGVWLWFVARIAYIPLYLGGVPYVRSLAWAASIAGILIVLAQLL